MPRCEHFQRIEILPLPDEVAGCEECLKLGADWVHLRMCLECGHIGCCDSSNHQHARKHRDRRNHQLIRSAEPGEDWAYCYEHETYTRLG